MHHFKIYFLHLLPKGIFDVAAVKMMTNCPCAPVSLLEMVHVGRRCPIIVEEHAQQNQRGHSLQIPVETQRNTILSSAFVFLKSESFKFIVQTSMI